MKTNLITIDNGNSHPHVGLFQQGDLHQVISLEAFENGQIWKSASYNDCPILLSQVGPWRQQFHLFHERIVNLRHFKMEKKFVDMDFDYTSTLGDDRLFQGYYLFHQHYFHSSPSPLQVPLLLADCGTFLTLDIISSQGLEGGLIFPGIEVFLNSYGGGRYLPLLSTKDLDLDSPQTIPHSTEEAIFSASKIYLQGLFHEFFSIYPQIGSIMLTGGQGGRLEKALSAFKRPVFLEKDLIHYSLAFIYHRLQLLGKEIPLGWTGNPEIEKGQSK